MLASLGIGTYLGEPDAATDESYTAAVVAAVEGGINVVDSAINYRFQRSERSIGAALRELFSRGYSREEIVLCTKGGFLTTDGDVPGDEHAYLEREYLHSGILDPKDVAAGCHAMSPSFLADQLDRSRANLGVDCVDIYYIHNPETQLDEVPRQEFSGGGCGRPLSFSNPRAPRAVSASTVWPHGTVFASRPIPRNLSPWLKLNGWRARLPEASTTSGLCSFRSIWR